jgi:YrbI family 3-deoxy-D-manno-octulosonate 8-phosphate phosphatase
VPHQQENSTNGPGSTVGVVAVIPARGGSKGVPGKNLAMVGGRSLLGRAVEACRTSGAIDVIAVSTDDSGIAAEAERFGAVVVERPTQLAGDEASSESAVLHAIDVLGARGIDPSVVAFVQCTSPFISPSALASAVERVRADRADSVFAACETFDFLWTQTSDGAAHGLNHDASVRLRRQDRVGDWRETGAFYVMATAGFVAARHRFFGRTEIEPVAVADAIEIDTPEDLRVARALATARGRTRPSLAGVTALVTDFDGVHTDDAATVDETGRESVRVSRRDGHGIKLLRGAGVPVLILSTEVNAVVARRAEKLGVECVHGLDDKADVLSAWMQERGLDPSSVAYLGNDVNDLGCLELVGHPIAVADAHPRVLDVVSHVTSAAGGHGAVREIAEAIIHDLSVGPG